MKETDLLKAMTPAQRVALAGELLTALTRDRRFDRLLLLDRAAFRPYADTVLGWDDEQLCRLYKANFRNFWKIARGAADAAVDALAGTIRANLPALAQNRANATHYRVELLIGADTGRAHAHLADLARQSAEVACHCHECHLEIPASGPAVRRFAPDFLDINAYQVTEGDVVHTAGLDFPLEAADYMPENRGWVCLAPPAHILTVRLDLLPGDPLAASPLKRQHWFSSSGEECCDEATVGHSLAYRVLSGSDRLVTLVTNLSYPDELRDAEGACDYEDGDREPFTSRHRLVLEPFVGERLKWPHEHLGRLGGYPDWWQQPETPDCPLCGRLMFYVGQVDADVVRKDVIHAALYAFHCEDCGVGAQVVQIT